MSLVFILPFLFTVRCLEVKLKKFHKSKGTPQRKGVHGRLGIKKIILILCILEMTSYNKTHTNLLCTMCVAESFFNLGLTKYRIAYGRIYPNSLKVTSISDLVTQFCLCHFIS